MLLLSSDLIQNTGLELLEGAENHGDGWELICPSFVVSVCSFGK